MNCPGPDGDCRGCQICQACTPGLPPEWQEILELNYLAGTAGRFNVLPSGYFVPAYLQGGLS